MEQHWQFCQRFVGIFLDEFQHCILDNIQSLLFVPNRKLRVLVSATFDVGKKVRKLLRIGQLSSPRNIDADINKIYLLKKVNFVRSRGRVLIKLPHGKVTPGCGHLI